MIRSLRQRHRLIMTVLAVALVTLFIAALLVRQPIPDNSRIPDKLITTQEQPADRSSQ